MNRFFLCSLHVVLPLLPAAQSAERSKLPNIIYVMTDNMAYADIGPYGQEIIRTPHLDRMAREGIKFTDVYSGALVCAPARSVLMTGQHTGHTRVRDNTAIVGGILDHNEARRVPLEPRDVTVAEVLKARGYVTGMSGKWGLGDPGTTGEPFRQGFDEFFGFLNQNHAHDHYPEYLWSNREKVIIEQNAGGKRGQHGHELFTNFARDFIRRRSRQPFFLYVPYTMPHPEYVAPTPGPYADQSWSKEEKGLAAMIDTIDRDMGKFFGLLRELGIDDNTIVFFCSDNAGWNLTGRFNSNRGLRGEFGGMYEGGLRSPMLVRWPGKIPAGAVSHLPWTFADVLPTLADLSGATAPANIDGVSVLPTILGQRQDLDRMLYWEHHAPRAFWQAARWGRWKAIRRDRKAANFELYDLADDPQEKREVARANPAIVEKITAFMEEAHVPSPLWPEALWYEPRTKAGKAKSTTQAKPKPVIRDLAADGSVSNPSDEELKAFLEHVPAPSPAAMLKTFETAPGFRMELVAAEPMVRDPIAAAFDEDGNLYVAEMRDYPYNGNEPVKVAWQENRPKSDGRPIGAIRLLRDTDGDGRFDVSHIFADGLLWAGGIQPWKGGVFVTSPPDIWYFKDTDGDGKADIREKVFTGFGTENQQGMLNSLLFGLDHRIYGSTSINGGEIRPGNNPAARPISVKGRDFRFEPVSRRFEPQTGIKQFGMSFDDWGNRFMCTQGGPAYHVVLPLRYLERNPHFTPRATIFTAAPSPTPIFRISPIERWRHIRSSRRIANKERAATATGVSHHVVDAGAGVTIYRGGAYPKEYYGNLFLGDSVNNLVHRRVLVPKGAAFWTESADIGTEFVRSSNIWFRPVNFVNAPDGTLYCLDMAREYSESIHIPADVEKFIDLTSGNDKGRIYRIAPPGFRAPPPPRLSRATAAELVAALESPHGWWRDTAHRLLYERQDKSAVPALRRLAMQSTSPQARVHALWSLAGLDSLEDDAIAAGVTASHADLRENAIRLAEPRLETSVELREKIAALVSDPEPRVRLQVAFTIGESRQWNQAALLARLARENPNDSWIQAAILSSAVNCGGELFAALAADARLLGSSQAAAVLRPLVVFIGAQNRSSDVGRAIDAIARCENPAIAFTLLGGLGEGLKRAGTSLSAADSGGRIKVLLQRAPQVVRDATQPKGLREAAIDSLTLAPYAEAAPGLLAVLGSKQPETLHLAAIEALGQFRDPRVGPALLQHYPTLGVEGRKRVLTALLTRVDRIDSLWAGMENKVVGLTELTAAQVNSLRTHRDARVRERAVRWLGAVNPATRHEVYRAFLPALQLSGLAARGRVHFESRCASCHRYGGVGQEFGPDLSGSRTGGKEKLLDSIIDPNREVLPQFLVQNVETRDGENVAGILKDETATTITLRQPGGGEKTLSRAKIASMKTLDQSIMPEGLEAGLSHQDIADLIAFILNPD